MRNMRHKVPAGITDIHGQFRRPLIDIRKGVSLPLLFFQNNNQDCVLCDLSSGQREFDPLDVRQTRRQRLYCHLSEWKPTCSLCVLHRSNFCFSLGQKVTHLFQVLLNKLLFVLHHRSQYSSFNATANTKADVLCVSVPENTGITQAMISFMSFISYHGSKGSPFITDSIQMHHSDRIVNTREKVFPDSILKDPFIQKRFYIMS